MSDTVRFGLYLSHSSDGLFDLQVVNTSICISLGCETRLFPQSYYHSLTHLSGISHLEKCCRTLSTSNVYIYKLEMNVVNPQASTVFGRL